jgi:hypothetical protein
VELDLHHPSTRLDAAMLFCCVLAPLVAAASFAQPVADAGHDEAVARALGYAWSGAFRGLDVPIASALLWLPFGTRALRAALASAAASGAAGGLLFLLARGLLARCSDAPRVRALVAAVAATCASLGGAWVFESSCAGSSIVGVVLALAPLVLVAKDPRPTRWPLLCLVLGLAVSYEPLVGMVSFAGSLSALALSPRVEFSPTRTRGRLAARCMAALACGCVPFAFAFAWKPFAPYALDVGVGHAWSGEGAIPGAVDLVGLLHRELGWVLLALCVLGAVRSLAGRISRPLGTGVLAMLAASALAIALGSPAGQGRFGAPALTLLATVAVLAAVPMQWAVVAAARSQVALAPASAAMVLVLELTLPVLSLDDALARQDARAVGATRAWDDAAFEALPSGSVLFARDRDLHMRALASRATGELRGDLTLVPMFDIGGPVAERELARDPHLQPLWRDLLLDGRPGEWSLSEVAGSRPIAFAFGPRDERALLRHVLPRGLLTTFEPEPRGASERLRALDGSATEQAKLEEMIGAGKEPQLAVLTARLLDDRAVLLAALEERDGAARALGHTRSLEPLTSTLERVALHGATHSSRLVPTSP